MKTSSWPSKKVVEGGSARYLSRYLRGDKIPPSVSVDLIGKVAGRIEEMGKRRLSDRSKRA
jgi:hypothetical protein